MMKTMEIQLPPAGSIGAEIHGFDPRGMTEEDASTIKDCVYHHKLVVFRNQALSDVEYIDFARMLGRPQIYLQKHYHHPDHPEIFVSSNVTENGRRVGVPGTGQYWHSDYQFHTEPLPMTLIYPKVLPTSKRETYYIDMQRALESLPEDLRRCVEGTRATHEAKWRYKVTAADLDRAIIDILADVEKLAPPVTHPAVLRHPVTNVLSLYVSSGFTTGFVGRSHEENQSILRRLFSIVESWERAYVHTWKDGDILLWDNRQLVHRASVTPPGEQSCSYRIGVYDGLPFYVSSP